MKKLFVTILTLVTAAGAALAAPVTLERAKATASAFFSSQLGVNATVREVVQKSDTYYVMNMAPQGWIIISADDKAEPVLGYNETSRLSWHSMPGNMAGLLGSYDREIRAIRAIPTTIKHRRWARLSSPMGRSAVSRDDDEDGVTIAPLIKVDWDQDGVYNYYCPKNSSGQAIVGCVAVSMSQAMSVQRYPSRPTGSMIYSTANFGRLSIDFDAEKPYDWEAAIKGSNNSREAARILYHAGMAVKMGYGIDGSGIPSREVNRIPEALVNHFSYSEHDVKYFWRANYAGDWDNLILNELNAGRAVVYNAQDSKGGYGHSFNIDGYAGNRMFHVNWGWGGIGNGNFRLNNLADSRMGMNYDSDHVAVIGIGSPDRVLRSIELSEQIIDEKMPAGTVVGIITVNGEAPNSSCKLTVRGPYNKVNGSYADVPFEIKDNMLVTREPLTARTEPWQLSIIASQDSERLTSTFDVQVVPLRTIAQATSLSYDRTLGTFNVHTRNGAEYALTGSNGVVIAKGKLTNAPYFQFNRADLTNGENQLVITAGSETKTLTIVK